jgi:hypothetical protein
VGHIPAHLSPSLAQNDRFGAGLSRFSPRNAFFRRAKTTLVGLESLTYGSPTADILV